MSMDWAAHLGADRIATIIRLWWLRQLPSDIARQLELPVETVVAVIDHRDEFNSSGEPLGVHDYPISRDRPH